MSLFSRVYAKINLDSILYNLKEIEKTLKPDTKIICVIKTDGYGHGAIPIAKITEVQDAVWGFAVATVQEGIALRKEGIKKPILILGFTFPESFHMIIQHNLQPTVFQYDIAVQLSKVASALNKTVHIHIAVDTGMGRIGFEPTEESAKIVEDINQLPNVKIEGLFTHFSKADETDKSYTILQKEKYDYFLKQIEDRNINIPLKHVSNSAAIMDLPEYQNDAVRAGIILYGLWPSNEVNKNALNLQPAMELKSHVAYIKKVKENSYISYGGTYCTKEERMIATIPVGYGDGYPRSLSNKGYVLINGFKAPIVGRICMDQFMVDVTDVEDIKLYDEVTLIGKDHEEIITIEELSDLSDRLNYEFSCNIGKRIPRLFFLNDIQIDTCE